MPLFYEKKQLVTPGDLLAEGDYVSGDSTYKENGKIYACRLGLVDYDGKRVYVVERYRAEPSCLRLTACARPEQGQTAPLVRS